MAAKDKATGLRALLGEHWEKFMPRLLAIADSEQTKQGLLDALREMVFQQTREFGRILTEGP